MTPSQGIVICGEVVEGKLTTVTREVLALGKKLHNDLDQPLVAVLVGGDIQKAAEEAVRLGAAMVYVADGPIFSETHPDRYVVILAEAIKRMEAIGGCSRPYGDGARGGPETGNTAWNRGDDGLHSSFDRSGIKTAAPVQTGLWRKCCRCVRFGVLRPADGYPSAAGRHAGEPDALRTGRLKNSVTVTDSMVQGGPPGNSDARG